MSNFYCIYDNLYEEYQMPFVMKNDNVALLEFDIFKQSLLEKAKDDNEKKSILSRYFLVKFDGLQFKQDIGAICIESKTEGRMYEIHPNGLMGEDNNE